MNYICTLVVQQTCNGDYIKNSDIIIVGEWVGSIEREGSTFIVHDRNLTDDV